MWRQWALIVTLLAAPFARGDDSSKPKITNASDVERMTDLVGLTDDELYALFSDPGNPDPGHMPSQVRSQKQTTKYLMIFHQKIIDPMWLWRFMNAKAENG